MASDPLNGDAVAGTSSQSPAQLLADKHDQATVEAIPDEDDLAQLIRPHPATPSTVLESLTDAPNPAGNQKENKPDLDTTSEELFPALGSGPKPKQSAYAAPGWTTGGLLNGRKQSASNSDEKKRAPNGFASNGTLPSPPSSGTATPVSRGGPLRMAIPGRYEQKLEFESSDLLPRNQLKKPIPEIIKDLNKRSKATVDFSQLNKKVWVGGIGPNQEIVNKALADLADLIFAKKTEKVSIPRSAKSHIIGKGGVTIKAISERCRVRIMVSKEEAPAGVHDDEDMVEVQIDGNPLALQRARQEIVTIAGERTPTMTTKLRDIPAEFYPFIAGPHNERVNKMEEIKGIQIRVPPHYKWAEQAPPQRPSPGQRPVFLPAAGDNHITLAGDRAAVQAARDEIAHHVEELRRELTLDQFDFETGRQQFIVGDLGVSPEKFFGETGCAIILPSEPNDETITFVGPPEKIESAIQKAQELMYSMQSSTLDISQKHRNAPSCHVRNFTQYLRDREEIDRIEKLYQTHVFTPFPQEGLAAPWQLYSRDGARTANARAEILKIINGHPPSRFANIPVDPFFHAHLTKDISPRVKQEYGVHVVLPSESGDDAVLLVFEGPAGSQPDYRVPQIAPSREEEVAFQRGLEAAYKHISDIINAQAQIISEFVDVPQIFHEKLRKFIKQEQESRAADQIPVRVSALGTTITLRGPAPSVELLTAKVNAFVEQAIQDEKERDFSLEFDFPQNHANQLIGKGGKKIRELRDEFDVEIQVDGGKVTLKGPKAKAEAARAHISSLGRHWADEATHILKIEPKFHPELIGAQGGQINRLQTRYKVQIHFPRSGRPKEDHSSTGNASEAGRKGNQELDEVMIRGPKKGADEARDEILSLLQYLKDNSNTATVTVRQSLIPSLIGQRGANMDQLRESTGAKIDVPNARDSSDPSAKVDIKIRGTKSQVAQAKEALETMRDLLDQIVSKTLEVDKKYHKALIGVGGGKIRDIIIQAGGSDDRQSSRIVQFPKAESEGNTITVEGKEDLVEKIIQLIQETVSKLEDQTTSTIDVPTDKHRFLIGRGGETKKDLESKFKVSIVVPRQGGKETGVKITGLPVDVEKAKAHILSLVKDQEGRTLSVPARFHHAIADNGHMFRNLRNNYQVTVDHANHEIPPKPSAPENPRTNGGSSPLITDEDESVNAFSWNVVTIGDSDVDVEIPWILRGAPENIAKAEAIITEAIQQASSNTSTGYLVLPDPRTFRYIIGPNGNTVKIIRDATGCKITVPRRPTGAERGPTGAEAIIVSGTAEGVEKAKELILQTVREGAEP